MTLVGKSRRTSLSEMRCTEARTNVGKVCDHQLIGGFKEWLRYGMGWWHVWRYLYQQSCFILWMAIPYVNPYLKIPTPPKVCHPFSFFLCSVDLNMPVSFLCVAALEYRKNIDLNVCDHWSRKTTASCRFAHYSYCWRQIYFAYCFRVNKNYT